MSARDLAILDQNYELAEALAWMADGNCRGVDPELFFPTKTSSGVQAVRAARAICHGCTVRHECLHWAITTGEEAGVYGGLSAKERREHRRITRRIGA